MKQTLDKNKISSICQLIKQTSKKGGIIYLAGNGGSASTASHMSTDLTKNAKIKSMSFNDVNLITCFSNDYGYENWMKKSVELYGEKGDILIVISSSGNSKNIHNAIKMARKKRFSSVITFSGFKNNNPLSQFGDVNIHINSNNYNYIEMSHHIILVAIVDIFAQKLI